VLPDGRLLLVGGDGFQIASMALIAATSADGPAEVRPEQTLVRSPRSGREPESNDVEVVTVFGDWITYSAGKYVEVFGRE